MKIKEVSFVKSATKASQYPDLKLPEIAFYGRSNSGKSTLINILTMKPGLVKTGSKPGMTRHINFFLANKAFTLVDLPGYGYAALPDPLKKSFTPMIREYFSTRANLKMVFLLMDIRRTVGADDLEIIAFLAEHQVPTALVATKADKLGKNDIQKNLFKISAALDIPKENIFVSSSHSKQGIKDMERLIGDLLTGQIQMNEEYQE